jgi:hypothetical protein
MTDEANRGQVRDRGTASDGDEPQRHMTPATNSQRTTPQSTPAITPWTTPHLRRLDMTCDYGLLRYERQVLDVIVL